MPLVFTVRDTVFLLDTGRASCRARTEGFCRTRNKRGVMELSLL